MVPFFSIKINANKSASLDRMDNRKTKTSEDSTEKSRGVYKSVNLEQWHFNSYGGHLKETPVSSGKPQIESRRGYILSLSFWWLV